MEGFLNYLLQPFFRFAVNPESPSQEVYRKKTSHIRQWEDEPINFFQIDRLPTDGIHYSILFEDGKIVNEEVPKKEKLKQQLMVLQFFYHRIDFITFDIVKILPRLIEGPRFTFIPLFFKEQGKSGHETIIIIDHVEKSAYLFDPNVETTNYGKDIQENINIIIDKIMIDYFSLINYNYHPLKWVYERDFHSLNFDEGYCVAISYMFVYLMVRFPVPPILMISIIQSVSLSFIHDLIIHFTHDFYHYKKDGWFNIKYGENSEREVIWRQIIKEVPIDDQKQYMSTFSPQIFFPLVYGGFIPTYQYTFLRSITTLSHPLFRIDVVSEEKEVSSLQEIENLITTLMIILTTNIFDLTMESNRDYSPLYDKNISFSEWLGDKVKYIYSRWISIKNGSIYSELFPYFYYYQLLLKDNITDENIKKIEDVTRNDNVNLDDFKKDIDREDSESFIIKKINEFLEGSNIYEQIIESFGFPIITSIDIDDFDYDFFYELIMNTYQNVMFSV